MNINSENTEKKLLQRLDEIENMRHITNDAELMTALKKIIDEEINSKNPDTLLIDEAVNFTLALEGYDIEKVEKEGTQAGNEFYNKIVNSNFSVNEKKFSLRCLKIALIAAAVAIMLTVGAFSALKTFDIDLMDSRTFLSLKEDTVYEDEKYTLVISDNMVVYYDSIDEMMEAEGLESILVPDGEIEEIRAYTVVYTSELKSRKIMFKIDGLWLHINLDLATLSENAILEKVGKFDVDFFEYDDKILANWIYDEKYYSINSHSKNELVEIIKNMKEYIK